jgi:hypothetical protein
LPIAVTFMFMLFQNDIYRFFDFSVDMKMAIVHVLGVPIHQLIGIESSNGHVSEHTRDLLKIVLNYDVAMRNFHKYDFATLMFNDSLRIETLNQNAIPILRAWVISVIQNPALSISLIFDLYKIYWSFDMSLAPGYPYILPILTDSDLMWRDVSPNLESVRQISFVPEMQNIILKGIFYLRNRYIVFLVLPSTWFILLGLSLFFIKRLNAIVPPAALVVIFCGLIVTMPLVPFPQVRFYWILFPIISFYMATAILAILARVKR